MQAKIICYNRLEKRETLSRKKFQDPAGIWTRELLISSQTLDLLPLSYWTQVTAESSVGRWYSHRISFKFRLCLYFLKGGGTELCFAAEQRGAQPRPRPSKQSLTVMAWLKLFFPSLACFQHLPLPRPLVLLDDVWNVIFRVTIINVCSLLS